MAQILELVVDAKVRSHGTGKTLFDAAVSYAREQGCEGIELETDSWRHDVHRFYERMGMMFDHHYYTMRL